MSPPRLDLLFVSLFPPSPPTFGAQRRIEGLMRALSRRHRLTAVSLLSPSFDGPVAEAAMREYCEQVALVPARPDRGLQKRLLQLGSLLSWDSFERRVFGRPALQRTLDGLLRRNAYQVVVLEAPYIAHLRVRQAPAGAPPPRLLLDEHNVEYDLARQSRDASQGWLRRLYHSVNWRKIEREEVAAWGRADGVAFTSGDDEARARAVVPSIRAAVIPNGVDIGLFRPRVEDPPPDGTTVLFFGTLDYFPNQDGMLFFLEQVWPFLLRSHPRARLQVIGPHPTPEVLAYRGPRIDVAGLVDDLRPHLARAAAVIVPLRVGGGTRFKILEAMAMGKAVVSTSLGAEGIGAVQGRDLLLADEPAAFAAAVGRLLDDPGLATRLGVAGRALVERSYSWEAVGLRMDRFLGQVLEGPRAPGA